MFEENKNLEKNPFLPTEEEQGEHIIILPEGEELIVPVAPAAEAEPEEQPEEQPETEDEIELTPESEPEPEPEPEPDAHLGISLFIH